jgi:hypothetical protein
MKKCQVFCPFVVINILKLTSRKKLVTLFHAWSSWSMQAATQGMQKKSLTVNALISKEGKGPIT